MILVSVINLKRAASRRENIEKNLSKLGIPFRIFEAIDSKVLTDNEILAMSPKPYAGDKNRELSRGEVACALSHLQVLKNFLSTRDDYICVAEDDVEFTLSSRQVLTKYFCSSLPSFDILRLINDPPSDSIFTRIIKNDTRFEVHAPLRVGYYMAAQIYSRDGARKVIDNLLPLSAPIDCYIYRDSGIIGLRLLEIRPAVVEIKNFISDIESERKESFIAMRVKLDTVSNRMRRKLYIWMRSPRSFLSYLRAWGLSGLVKLRFHR